MDMEDIYANDVGIPVGSVPRQDWRRLPWRDLPASSAPTETIMTSAGVFRAAESLLGEARSDWITIRPPDWPANLPQLDPVQLWPVPADEHVHARAIYHHRFTNRPPGRPLVRKHIAAGEEARVSHDVALGILIADTTAGLVVMPPGIGVLYRDTVNVERLRAVFEKIWEASLPFGRPALPPMQGKVLDLLTAGFNFKQIAEKLGISPRAASAYAGDIRRRLNAETLVQASALSHLRGWID